MSFQQFNNSVNGMMDPILGNPVAMSALKLMIILYGSLAAPKLPMWMASYFSNSFFRIAVMILIIWTYNHDPALAVLIAVAYFLTLEGFMKKGLDWIQDTGIVPVDIASIFSGGSGPSIKGKQVIQAEASLMQQSVNNSKQTGYVTAPEAVVSGPVSTASNASIASIPSGNKADNPSMMASDPHGGVPSAFVPDDTFDLAAAV